jgi:hypothetical protein
MVVSGLCPVLILLDAGRVRVGRSLGRPRSGGRDRIDPASLELKCSPSHLILDILTHNGDIPLGPFAGAPEYGTFLYGRLPLVAFLVELACGLLCWRELPA